MIDPCFRFLNTLSAGNDSLLHQNYPALEYVVLYFFSTNIAYLSLRLNFNAVYFWLFAAGYNTDAQDDIQYEEKSDRAMMRELPAEDRAKIQHQVELFRMEKLKLDQEIGKWDDSGNDIITLAKQMCMIMMEMTDFTR